MNNYHVIMHTHWDREWYFTKEETKVLLKNHMIDLFDYLEGNPHLVYILDGQSVMMDDFMELAPEYESDLHKHIASGQIRVGPWYTQTDLMLIRGESIVRNLYYGLKTAREYTDQPMLVGYAPDTFGHNAQMPQIYSGFGIKSTYFWRGVSKELSKDANFEWKALNESKIFAHSLSAGYQGAKYLEADKATLNKRLRTIQKKYNDYNSFNPILVMNGHDQMPVQRNMDDIKDEFNKSSNQSMEISDFESYEKKVRAKSQLKTVSGELYDPEFTRVHKTISSSRMDIKLLNTYVEDQIFNVLEPLSSIAYAMNLPYPHALIEKALKLLFGVHAHDSIGGCNTDLVNEAIKQRILDAKELVDNQIELTLRLINKLYGEKGYDAVAINLLPYAQKDVKTSMSLQTKSNDFEIVDANNNLLSYQISKQSLEDMSKIDRQIRARRLDIKRYESEILVTLKDIPALSVMGLKVKEKEAKSVVENRQEDLFIENGFYRIDFDQTLLALIKSNGKVIENFITVENNGDGGDGYDYSPLHKDWTLGEEYFKLMDIVDVKKGSLFEEVVLNFQMTLPFDESERVQRKTSTKQDFLLTLRLTKNEKEIKLKIETQNKLKDSRMRLKVKTLESSDKVISDTQFGNQKRPAINPNLQIWEKEKWVEKPVSIEHYESYVSINNQNLVYSKGLKEYEFVDSAFYLTMYRSFAYMGRSDLINRPGRASGMAVPTPLNQLLESEFNLEFWINYEGEPNPDVRSKELLTQVKTYQLKEINRFNINPFTKSRFGDLGIDIDLKSLSTTAIKMTEGHNLLIRAYNPSSKSVTIDLKNQWSLSNLNEERLKVAKEIKVQPYEIITIIKRRKNNEEF